jgi:hypothetical protein
MPPPCEVSFVGFSSPPLSEGEGGVSEGVVVVEKDEREGVLLFVGHS